MHTQPVNNTTLLQQLQWRYATKKFDSARKISAADWETLEQALILSPSSYGLQPYKFVLVSDAAIRARLVPVSWNQPQPVDCSHFVVFARQLSITEAEVDHYMARISEVRGVPAASLAGFRGMVAGDVVHGPRGKVQAQWSACQAYIALGNFMTSAALLGIDTCPMEGFDPAQYDEILGLAGKGLGSVVACAAGYRAADDASAALAKVRFPRSELVSVI